MEKVYLDLIEALHRYEPVLLLVDPTAVTRAEKRLSERNLDRSRIHLRAVPINDVWARDCGPIFIRREKGGPGLCQGNGGLCQGNGGLCQGNGGIGPENGSPRRENGSPSTRHENGGPGPRHANGGREEFAITDWIYNAWGGKYPPWDDDNRLPQWFAKTFGLRRFEPGLVLEGGAIETNGEGLFLTTESVLLNPNRNPGTSREEMECALREWLGAEMVIWLGEGLAGDDTDGHIDDLSRFLNPTTVLTMVAEDPQDVNYHALRENHQRLLRARDLNGRPLTVVTLPMPRTRIEGTTVDGSEHVPASYANFYFANGAVLLPLYEERTDRLALELFRKVFPDRKVIGIPCADLVWGQGSIHCITQQLYALDFTV